ncbi:MAG: hypothetical protein R2795_17960 [Saprospiraceae bacterium]
MLLGIVVVRAQHIPVKGIPEMRRFTADQYPRHGKIWDIAAASNGIMYMAGDAGLLAYDGIRWQQWAGSKGITRSLCVINDSLIYSGSDLDFGVWQTSTAGVFQYTSLYPFQADGNAAGEEFWDVFAIRDFVLFVSFQHVYVYKDNQFTKTAAPSRFRGSFQAGDKLYLVDEKEGVFTFDGRTMQRVFSYPEGSFPHIVGAMETQHGLMLATRDAGIWWYRSGQLLPSRSALSQRLAKDQVFSFAVIDGQYPVFGSILNGVYIADGDENTLQHINKQKDLPNNTVLSACYTPTGMLWLGMDYGMAAIRIHGRVAYFHDNTGAYGTAQTAFLLGDTFYLGTNQGLYQAAWASLDNDRSEKPTFSLVRGSEGQVWSLQEIDGILYCGHDRGLFRVEGASLVPVHNEPGVWTMLPWQRDYLLTETIMA